METHEKERETVGGDFAQSYGHTVTLLGLLAGGRGPIPAPSAIAGLSGGLLGAQCRVSRGNDSGAGAAGSVVDSLVAKVEEMDQLFAQLEQLSDHVAEG